MEALTKIENSIVSLMYKGVDDDAPTPANARIPAR